MKTFWIYFFGLICHIGSNSRTKDFAVMVRDDEHERLVVFDVDKEVPLIGKKEVKFRLGGKIVESTVTADDTFVTSVPSLKTIMGGVPRLNDLETLAVKIQYPPSVAKSLTVARYFAHPGVLAVDKKEGFTGCAARLVALKVESLENELEVVAVTEAGNVVSLGKVAAGSAVVIANRPNKHAHGGPPHVRKFGRILTAEDSEVYADEDTMICCPKLDPAVPWVSDWLKKQYAKAENSQRKKLDVGITGTTLECGNTNWP